MCHRMQQTLVGLKPRSNITLDGMVKSPLDARRFASLTSHFAQALCIAWRNCVCHHNRTTTCWLSSAGGPLGRPARHADLAVLLQQAQPSSRKHTLDQMVRSQLHAQHFASLTSHFAQALCIAWCNCVCQHNRTTTCWLSSAWGPLAGWLAGWLSIIRLILGRGMV